MGAKLSASSGVSPEPLPPPPPLPPTAPPPVPADSATTAVEELKNPGDYEEIGKKVKEQLFPMPFEGAKVMIQKGLSNHFQTMHTLVLGASPSWQYGATYVGTKKLGENEFRPVMIGDMSTAGNFTALYIDQFGSCKLKLNAQAQQGQWVGYQGTLDYVGKDFTASATVANPDLFTGTGVLVTQYLQAMTNRLALGSELVYQRSGGMQGSMISLGGYYKADMWAASARLGLHSWSVNYHQKLNDQLTFMTTLDGSLMQNETSAAVGYMADIGSLTVKGKLSSHGTASVTVDKRLEPLPATLTLSGMLNHWTDESRFGMAIVVG